MMQKLLLLMSVLVPLLNCSQDVTFLSFHAQRNRANQSENVVRIATESVIANSVTVCFRASLRYSTEIALLGDARYKLSIIIKPNEHTGYLKFGDELLQFYLDMDIEPFAWNSFCFLMG